MNCLGIALLFAVTLCTVSADSAIDKTKQATHPIYKAEAQYYPYSNSYAAVPNYDNYDAYRRYDNYGGYNYGAYPVSYDTGDQRLQLSGGIYRPYGYEDAVNYNTGYGQYAYDNAYYNKAAASRYGRNPYTHRRYY